MSPRAKYRARKLEPRPDTPRRAFRWRRTLVIVLFLVLYGAALWYVVFPWVDRSFVNQPAV
jgi:hypothetical protein